MQGWGRIFEGSRGFSFFDLGCEFPHSPPPFSLLPTQGQVHVRDPHKPVAYMSQSPAIVNGSVRANILFGRR